MVAGKSPLPEETLDRYLRAFVSHAAIPTVVEDMVIGPVAVPKYTNEFWTSRQRQASSIHEISYRACFKPQLPRFFIDLLTRKGDVVYDPFRAVVQRSSKPGFPGGVYSQTTQTLSPGL